MTNIGMPFLTGNATAAALEINSFLTGSYISLDRLIGQTKWGKRFLFMDFFFIIFCFYFSVIFTLAPAPLRLAAEPLPTSP